MSASNRAYKLLFPKRHITRNHSEQLCWDDPKAVEVAAPLFDAGITIAAITERLDYHLPPQVPSLSGEHVFTLHLQGELGMLTGKRNHWLRPGQLVCNPAGTMFRRMSVKGSRTWWLYISIKDMPLWEGLKSRGPYVRSYEPAAQLYLLLRSLLDTHRSRRAEAMPLAKANARSLVELLKVELAAAGGPGPSYRQSLSQLVEDIRARPGENWNIERMVKALGVSRATLTRIFRNEEGLAPKEFVIKERIAFASGRLAHTDETIEEIARALGYRSHFTFSHLFQQHTGIRPGTYREQFRAGGPN